jgi:hypothetical protein
MRASPTVACALLAAFACGERAAAQARAGEYLGPASCDATCCHGAAKPETGRIARNEYAIWAAPRDPHFKAWTALSSGLGRRMQEHLRREQPDLDVTRAQECLSCHAVPAAAADLACGVGSGGGAGATPDGDSQRAPMPASLAQFGVSCEACHGPASGWYGTHFRKDFERAAAVARDGLRDLLDPVQLANRCAGCHVGDEERVVDHRLIAAGHPELSFELGTFLLEMNPHWRQRGAQSREWLARAALVGQAVALRADLERLARANDAGTGPDLASFECSSCHHAVQDPAWLALREWRIAKGRTTPLGQPLLDSSRFATANAAIAAVKPELAGALATSLENVERLLERPLPRHEAVRAAAGEAAALCDEATSALAGHADPLGAAQAAAAALSLRAQIAAAEGFKGAEQAGRLLLALRMDLAPDRWDWTPGGAAAAIHGVLVAPVLEGGREHYDPVFFSRKLAELPARQ